MALPTSGPLSFSMIANEQGISLSNVSLRSMSVTAGFTTPDAISEFYGYSNAFTWFYQHDNFTSGLGSTLDISDIAQSFIIGSDSDTNFGTSTSTGNKTVSISVDFGGLVSKLQVIQNGVTIVFQSGGTFQSATVNFQAGFQYDIFAEVF